MALSNYLNSDLSNDKYKYDLVVGTTADAINASMKMWLHKNAPAAKQIWYQQIDVGGPITPMDPISGLDVFNIPNGATDLSETLLESPFMFAINAGFGLPPGVSPLDIPDIIELTSQRQQVNYNMFFNQFNIVTLDWGRRGQYAWKNYKQPVGQPYIFNYKVDLNMNAADPSSKFSDLPPDAQRILQNYNTHSMYSVQQLFLDLNNAGLQSVPTISGIPSNSPVLRTLQEDFINTYWKDINEKKQFVLGYAVHATNRGTAASIQPTSLNFQVVPYYDANGQATNKTNLYTLNYLSMTEGRALTVGAAFPWNWVDEDKVSEYHGSMAIRRNVFADFLASKINPFLSKVCIDPSSHITISNAGFSWSSTFNISSSSNGQFSATDTGPTILEFSFTGSSQSSDKSGLISGHFNMNSSASGSVSVSGNEITLKIDSNVNMDFDNGDIGGAGAVKGSIGSYSLETKWQVSVDAQGAVNVATMQGYPHSTVKGPHLSEGAFSKIDGSHNVGSKLSNMFNEMTNQMKNFSTVLRDYLNSSGGRWIFPGGNTFIFKDAVFSQSQDFVAHISYGD